MLYTLTLAGGHRLCWMPAWWRGWYGSCKRQGSLRRCVGLTRGSLGRTRVGAKHNGVRDTLCGSQVGLCCCQVLSKAIRLANDVARFGSAGQRQAYAGSRGLPVLIGCVSHPDAMVRHVHTAHTPHPMLQGSRCHCSHTGLFQVRVPAVLAMANFVSKDTACRDVMLANGAVHSLEQVRACLCGCCVRGWSAGGGVWVYAPAATDIARRVCVPSVCVWQFVEHGDLSQQAADRAAWVACVLAGGQSRPSPAAVRALGRACVCACAQ